MKSEDGNATIALFFPSTEPLYLILEIKSFCEKNGHAGDEADASSPTCVLLLPLDGVGDREEPDRLPLDAVAELDGRVEPDRSVRQNPDDDRTVLTQLHLLGAEVDDQRRRGRNSTGCGVPRLLLTVGDASVTEGLVHVLVVPEAGHKHDDRGKQPKEPERKGVVLELALVLLLVPRVLRPGCMLGCHSGVVLDLQRADLVGQPLDDQKLRVDRLTVRHDEELPLEGNQRCIERSLGRRDGRSIRGCCTLQKVESVLLRLSLLVEPIQLSGPSSLSSNPRGEFGLGSRELCVLGRQTVASTVLDGLRSVMMLLDVRGLVEFLVPPLAVEGTNRILPRLAHARVDRHQQQHQAEDSDAPGHSARRLVVENRSDQHHADRGGDEQKEDENPSATRVVVHAFSVVEVATSLGGWKSRLQETHKRLQLPNFIGEKNLVAGEVTPRPRLIVDGLAQLADQPKLLPELALEVVVASRRTLQQGRAFSKGIIRAFEIRNVAQELRNHAVDSDEKLVDLPQALSLRAGPVRLRCHAVLPPLHLLDLVDHLGRLGQGVASAELLGELRTALHQTEELREELLDPLELVTGDRPERERPQERGRLGQLLVEEPGVVTTELDLGRVEQGALEQVDDLVLLVVPTALAAGATAAGGRGGLVATRTTARVAATRAAAGRVVVVVVLLVGLVLDDVVVGDRRLLAAGHALGDAPLVDVLRTGGLVELLRRARVVVLGVVETGDVRGRRHVGAARVVLGLALVVARTTEVLGHEILGRVGHDCLL